MARGAVEAGVVERCACAFEFLATLYKSKLGLDEPAPSSVLKPLHISILSGLVRLGNFFTRKRKCTSTLVL